MRFLTFVVLALTLIGCAKDGSNGTNGVGGNNGHSLVSVARLATNIECAVTVGSAIDVYLDVDDSLSYTPGDILQSGIVACNGQDGEDGEPGAPGTSASMTAYSLSGTTSCVNVAPTVWAKRHSELKVRLFSDNSCSSQIDTGGDLRSDSNELFVLDSTLFIVEGEGSATIIRKLVY